MMMVQHGVQASAVQDDHHGDVYDDYIGSVRLSSVQAPPVQGDHYGEKEDVYDHYIGNAKFGGLLFSSESNQVTTY